MAANVPLVHVGCEEIPFQCHFNARRLSPHAKVDVLRTIMSLFVTIPLLELSEATPTADSKENIFLDTI